VARLLKKRLDIQSNSLLYVGVMSEVIVKIRHTKSQVTLTIPKKIAELTGFRKAVFAGITANLDGTLTIRRAHVGTGNKGVI